MPKYVIQKHRHGGKIHWDLMLEAEQSLATWKVTAEPSDWYKATTPCEKIFDHRLKYLTYEGPLSHNRGQVSITAAGTYIPLEIGEKCWKVTLSGDTISGTLELKCIEQSQWGLDFQGEFE